MAKAEVKKSRRNSELYLSESDVALLGHLATYNTLTIAQFVGLGVGNRTHVGERLQKFRNAGWVDSLSVPFREGPSVHWLTSRGAREVADLGLVPFPPEFRLRPYRHGAHLTQRVAIVDCHIALRVWAAANGYAVDWFKYEFQRSGSGEKLASATAIARNGKPDYIPDALGKITGSDGVSWVFALEMETGGKAASLDNHRRKLADRLDVLENFEVEQFLKWEHETALLMLFVFSDETMLDQARKIRPNPTANTWRSVHFQSLPAVRADFGGKWWRLSDLRKPFEL